MKKANIIRKRGRSKSFVERVRGEFNHQNFCKVLSLFIVYLMITLTFNVSVYAQETDVPEGGDEGNTDQNCMEHPETCTAVNLASSDVLTFFRNKQELVRLIPSEYINNLCEGYGVADFQDLIDGNRLTSEQLQRLQHDTLRRSTDLSPVVTQLLQHQIRELLVDSGRELGRGLSHEERLALTSDQIRENLEQLGNMGLEVSDPNYQVRLNQALNQRFGLQYPLNFNEAGDVAISERGVLTHSYQGKTVKQQLLPNSEIVSVQIGVESTDVPDVFNPLIKLIKKSGKDISICLEDGEIEITGTDSSGHPEIKTVKGGVVTVEGGVVTVTSGDDVQTYTLEEGTVLYINDMEYTAHANDMEIRIEQLVNGEYTVTSSGAHTITSEDFACVGYRVIEGEAGSRFVFTYDVGGRLTNVAGTQGSVDWRNPLLGGERWNQVRADGQSNFHVEGDFDISVGGTSGSYSISQIELHGRESYLYDGVGKYGNENNFDIIGEFDDDIYRVIKFDSNSEVQAFRTETAELSAMRERLRELRRTGRAEDEDAIYSLERDISRLEDSLMARFDGLSDDENVFYWDAAGLHVFMNDWSVDYDDGTSAYIGEGAYGYRDPNKEGKYVFGIERTDAVQKGQHFGYIFSDMVVDGKDAQLHYRFTYVDDDSGVHVAISRPDFGADSSISFKQNLQINSEAGVVYNDALTYGVAAYRGMNGQDVTIGQLMQARQGFINSLQNFDLALEQIEKIVEAQCGGSKKCRREAERIIGQYRTSYDNVILDDLIKNMETGWGKQGTAGGGQEYMTFDIEAVVNEINNAKYSRFLGMFDKDLTDLDTLVVLNQFVEAQNAVDVGHYDGAVRETQALIDLMGRQGKDDELSGVMDSFMESFYSNKDYFGQLQYSQEYDGMFTEDDDYHSMMGQAYAGLYAQNGADSDFTNAFNSYAQLSEGADKEFLFGDLYVLYGETDHAAQRYANAFEVGDNSEKQRAINALLQIEIGRVDISGADSVADVEKAVHDVLAAFGKKYDIELSDDTEENAAKNYLRQWLAGQTNPEGFEDYEKQLKGLDDGTSAHSQAYAQFLIANGRYGEGQVALDEANKRKFREVNARVLSSTIDQLRSDYGSMVSVGLLQGNIDIGNKVYDDALSTYRNVLILDSGNVQAQFGVVNSYANMEGEFDHALASAKDYFSIDGEKPGKDSSETAMQRQVLQLLAQSLQKEMGEGGITADMGNLDELATMLKELRGWRDANVNSEYGEGESDPLLVLTSQFASPIQDMIKKAGEGDRDALQELEAYLASGVLRDEDVSLLFGKQDGKDTGVDSTADLIGNARGMYAANRVKEADRLIQEGKYEEAARVLGDVEGDRVVSQKDGKDVTAGELRSQLQQAAAAQRQAQQGGGAAITDLQNGEAPESTPTFEEDRRTVERKAVFRETLQEQANDLTQRINELDDKIAEADKELKNMHESFWANLLGDREGTIIDRNSYVNERAKLARELEEKQQYISKIDKQNMEIMANYDSLQRIEMMLAGEMIDSRMLRDSYIEGDVFDSLSPEQQTYVKGLYEQAVKDETQDFIVEGQRFNSAGVQAADEYFALWDWVPFNHDKDDLKKALKKESDHTIQYIGWLNSRSDEELSSLRSSLESEMSTLDKEGVEFQSLNRQLELLDSISEFRSGSFSDTETRDDFIKDLIDKNAAVIDDESPILGSLLGMVTDRFGREERLMGEEKELEVQKALLASAAQYEDLDENIRHQMLTYRLALGTVDEGATDEDKARQRTYSHLIDTFGVEDRFRTLQDENEGVPDYLLRNFAELDFYKNEIGTAMGNAKSLDADSTDTDFADTYRERSLDLKNKLDYTIMETGKILQQFESGGVAIEDESLFNDIYLDVLDSIAVSMELEQSIQEDQLWGQLEHMTTWEGWSKRGIISGLYGSWGTVAGMFGAEDAAYAGDVVDFYDSVEDVADQYQRLISVTRFSRQSGITISDMQEHDWTGLRTASSSDGWDPSSSDDPIVRNLVEQGWDEERIRFYIGEMEEAKREGLMDVHGLTSIMSSGEGFMADDVSNLQFSNKYLNAFDQMTSVRSTLEMAVFSGGIGAATKFTMRGLTALETGASRLATSSNGLVNLAGKTGQFASGSIVNGLTRFGASRLNPFQWTNALGKPFEAITTRLAGSSTRLASVGRTFSNIGRYYAEEIIGEEILLQQVFETGGRRFGREGLSDILDPLETLSGMRGGHVGIHQSQAIVNGQMVDYEGYRGSIDNFMKNLERTHNLHRVMDMDDSGATIRVRMLDSEGQLQMELTPQGQNRFGDLTAVSMLVPGRTPTIIATEGSDFDLGVTRVYDSSIGLNLPRISNQPTPAVSVVYGQDLDIDGLVEQYSALDGVRDVGVIETVDSRGRSREGIQFTDSEGQLRIVVQSDKPYSQNGMSNYLGFGSSNPDLDIASVIIDGTVHDVTGQHSFRDELSAELVGHSRLEPSSQLATTVKYRGQERKNPGSGSILGVLNTEVSAFFDPSYYVDSFQGRSGYANTLADDVLSTLKNERSIAGLQRLQELGVLDENFDITFSGENYRSMRDYVQSEVDSILLENIRSLTRNRAFNQFAIRQLQDAGSSGGLSRLAGVLSSEIISELEAAKQTDASNFGDEFQSQIDSLTKQAETGNDLVENTLEKVTSGDNAIKNKVDELTESHRNSFAAVQEVMDAAVGVAGSYSDGKTFDITDVKEKQIKLLELDIQILQTEGGINTQALVELANDKIARLQSIQDSSVSSEDLALLLQPVLVEDLVNEHNGGSAATRAPVVETAEPQTTETQREGTETGESTDTAAETVEGESGTNTGGATETGDTPQRTEGTDTTSEGDSQAGEGQADTVGAKESTTPAGSDGEQAQTGSGSESSAPNTQKGEAEQGSGAESQQNPEIKKQLDDLVRINNANADDISNIQPSQDDINRFKDKVQGSITPQELARQILHQWNVDSQQAKESGETPLVENHFENEDAKKQALVIALKIVENKEADGKQEKAGSGETVPGETDASVDQKSDAALAVVNLIEGIPEEAEIEDGVLVEIYDELMDTKRLPSRSSLEKDLEKAKKKDEKWYEDKENLKKAVMLEGYNGVDEAGDAPKNSWLRRIGRTAAWLTVGSLVMAAGIKYNAVAVPDMRVSDALFPFIPIISVLVGPRITNWFAERGYRNSATEWLQGRLSEVDEGTPDVTDTVETEEPAYAIEDAITGGATGEFEQRVQNGKLFGITHEAGRSANQDSIGARFDPETGKTHLVVADGMGGHSAGEVASSMFVDRVLSFIKEGKSVKDVMESAGSELAAERTKRQSDLGTTGVVVEIDGNKLTHEHRGDSRLMIFGADGRLKFVSIDHSAPQQSVLIGSLKLQEADTSTLKNAITSSASDNSGDKGTSTVLVEVKGSLQSNIENGRMSPLGYVSAELGGQLVDEVELEEGDVVIVTTDGVHDVLTVEEISQIARRGDPTQVGKGLGSATIDRTSDNIGVAVYQHQRKAESVVESVVPPVVEPGADATVTTPDADPESSDGDDAVVEPEADPEASVESDVGVEMDELISRLDRDIKTQESELSEHLLGRQYETALAQLDAFAEKELTPGQRERLESFRKQVQDKLDSWKIPPELSEPVETGTEMEVFGEVRFEEGGLVSYVDGVTELIKQGKLTEATEKIRELNGVNLASFRTEIGTQVMNIDQIKSARISMNLAGQAMQAQQETDPEAEGLAELERAIDSMIETIHKQNLENKRASIAGGQSPLIMKAMRNPDLVGTGEGGVTSRIADEVSENLDWLHDNFFFPVFGDSVILYPVARDIFNRYRLGRDPTSEEFMQYVMERIPTDLVTQNEYDLIVSNTIKVLTDMEARGGPDALGAPQAGTVVESIRIVDAILEDSMDYGNVYHMKQIYREIARLQKQLESETMPQDQKGNLERWLSEKKEELGIHIIDVAQETVQTYEEEAADLAKERPAPEEVFYTFRRTDDGKLQEISNAVEYTAQVNEKVGESFRVFEALEMLEGIAEKETIDSLKKRVFDSRESLYFLSDDLQEKRRSIADIELRIYLEGKDLTEQELDSIYQDYKAALSALEVEAVELGIDAQYFISSKANTMAELLEQIEQTIVIRNNEGDFELVYLGILEEDRIIMDDIFEPDHLSQIFKLVFKPQVFSPVTPKSVYDNYVEDIKARIGKTTEEVIRAIDRIKAVRTELVEQLNKRSRSELASRTQDEFVLSVFDRFSEPSGVDVKPVINFNSNAVLKKENAGGLYSYESKAIFLGYTFHEYKGPMEEVTVHELAHYFWDVHMSESQKQEWIRYVKEEHPALLGLIKEKPLYKDNTERELANEALAFLFGALTKDNLIDPFTKELVTMKDISVMLGLGMITEEDYSRFYDILEDYGEIELEVEDALNSIRGGSPLIMKAMRNPALVGDSGYSGAQGAATMPEHIFAESVARVYSEFARLGLEDLVENLGLYKNLEGHITEVAALTALADRMENDPRYNDRFDINIEDLRTAAILHDIGKIRSPGSAFLFDLRTYNAPRLTVKKFVLTSAVKRKTAELARADIEALPAETYQQDLEGLVQGMIDEFQKKADGKTKEETKSYLNDFVVRMRERAAAGRGLEELYVNLKVAELEDRIPTIKNMESKYSPEEYPLNEEEQAALTWAADNGFDLDSTMPSFFRSHLESPEAIALIQSLDISEGAKRIILGHHFSGNYPEQFAGQPEYRTHETMLLQLVDAYQAARSRPPRDGYSFEGPPGHTEVIESLRSQLAGLLTRGVITDIEHTDMSDMVDFIDENFGESRAVSSP